MKRIVTVLPMSTLEWLIARIEIWVDDFYIFVLFFVTILVVNMVCRRWYFCTTWDRAWLWQVTTLDEGNSKSSFSKVSKWIRPLSKGWPIQDLRGRVNSAACRSLAYRDRKSCRYLSDFVGMFLLRFKCVILESESSAHYITIQHHDLMHMLSFITKGIGIIILTPGPYHRGYCDRVLERRLWAVFGGAHSLAGKQEVQVVVRWLRFTRDSQVVDDAVGPSKRLGSESFRS